MAKVRITAFCQGCESFIDTTIHASKAERIVAGFTRLHNESCYQEEPHGEDEAKPDPGKADAQQGGQDGTATGSDEPIH